MTIETAFILGCVCGVTVVLLVLRRFIDDYRNASAVRHRMRRIFRRMNGVELEKILPYISATIQEDVIATADLCTERENEERRIEATRR